SALNNRPARRQRTKLARPAPKSFTRRKSTKASRSGQGVFAASSLSRQIGGGLLKIFLLFTVIAVISLSFISLYRYLIASPYMKLEQVDVKGVDGKIGRKLLGMCGLNSDVSLLSLNLNELKQVMEEHPWVRSVELERRLPHTLIVRAEKESPSALVLMDRMYYMNRWGEVFKEVSEPENADLPVVTGVFERGPQMSGELKKASQIMRLLESEKGQWSLKSLSEIHIKKGGYISLYFGHLAAELKLMCEDFMSKMERLKRIVEHLSQTGRIHDVTAIDLNHVDGAVVSFRERKAG
ncbi:MAG: cell division protein FtsQ/DivIB, partial [Thermodesulfobacteriota bacterium]|nr:cell division protein FtsQ/DivIB [Thermodesulfobacteriota bacterium]